jgi:serine/threonine protein kinase
MNYFNWDRRLEMLHDVAAGMMYLHKRHYVHGDLRSPNLFVGLDGRVSQAASSACLRARLHRQYSSYAVMLPCAFNCTACVFTSAPVLASTWL